LESGVFYRGALRVMVRRAREDRQIGGSLVL